MAPGVRRTIHHCCLGLGLALLYPQTAGAAGGDGGQALLSGIGISIIAATVLAYLGNLTKQPLLLAYIAAGAAIGPHFGLGLVQSQGDIRIIAEIGLILLLFMIGLELDLRKLKASGKALIMTGVLQFLLCAGMGLGFFMLLGFTVGEPFAYEIFGVRVLGGEYDLVYLAVCTALSSTTIVVKLLHDKFELNTLAGRLTLGVLVFQDLWAIVVLSIQPTLADPRLMQLFWELGEGVALVLIALVLSKYLLGYVFRKIAKLPELMLVASLAWCFFICGLANSLGLSLEMGALVAGAAISTFPYNLDIIAKIVSIRDFFITLFFVALGMAIPNPLHNLGMLGVAGVAALFVVGSRFLSVFPILYLLRNGHRVSLLTAINLSQVSEFALVITTIGLKYGHIVQDIQTLIIYVFVMTSIVSSYMINSSHGLQSFLSKVLTKIGLKDITDAPREEEAEPPKEIVFLGFYRVASALFREIQELSPQLQDQLLVVDFNPQVHRRLRDLGVKVVYGDIGHPDTLHHAGIPEARVVLCTVPDEILVGTDNLRLIKILQKVSPQARIVVTAESPAAALKLYRAGADYVLLPHALAANQLLPIVEHLLREESARLREEEMERLGGMKEVLP